MVNRKANLYIPTNIPISHTTINHEKQEYLSDSDEGNTDKNFIIQKQMSKTCEKSKYYL